MAKLTGKLTLILLSTTFLTVVTTAVMLGTFSSELEAWSTKHLGSNYLPHILLLFIVTYSLIILLTYKPVRNFVLEKIITKQGNIKVIWSNENIELIREAKAAITKAEPEKALKHLHNLRDTNIEENLITLTNRLAKYRKDNLHGIQSWEENTVTYSQINKDILSLITSIEQNFEEDERDFREIREYLRKRYENRLNQKLAGRQPVNLRRHFSTEGTSKETSFIFKAFGSEEIRDEISNVFQESNGRLLIVGAPGSGKTTLLLQLGLSLLASERGTIPIVLSLVSWQSDPNTYTFETWLEQSLPSELGVTSRYAKSIIQQFSLILLLDGLDELRKEKRQSCLEAIGRYGKDAERQYVITSRIQEYKAIAKDAPVFFQIEVGPLTTDQLEAELEHIGYNQPEALRLLNAIRKDKLLKEAIKTPFYFNTMQLIFAEGKRLSDLNFSSDTLDGRKEEMILSFVASALTGVEEEKYSQKQAKIWLSFLSYQMDRFFQDTFELNDLQYYWWFWSGSQAFVAKLLRSLLFLPLLGLFWGPLIIFLIIFFEIPQDHTLILYIFLPFFFLLFLMLQLPVSGEEGTEIIPYIETVEKKRWSWILFLQNLKSLWRLSLAIVLLPILLNFTFRGLTGLTQGLVLGLLLGLIYSVLFAIFITLNKREYRSKFIKLNSPYQRFYTSLKYLNFSILRHFLLRYQLFRQGLLPLRLVDFLNEMTKRHLMESNGSTWRFRHRLIQDHFTWLWGQMIKEVVSVINQKKKRNLQK